MDWDSSEWGQAGEDPVAAAHPMDTAPVVSGLIDLAIDWAGDVAEDVYDWGSGVVQDLDPEIGPAPGSDGGDGGGPPAWEGDGGAPAY